MLSSVFSMMALLCSKLSVSGADNPEDTMLQLPNSLPIWSPLTYPMSLTLTLYCMGWWMPKYILDATDKGLSPTFITIQIGSITIPLSPGRSSGCWPQEYAIACSLTGTPGFSVPWSWYVKIGLDMLNQSLRFIFVHLHSEAELFSLTDNNESANLSISSLSVFNNCDGIVIICSGWTSGFSEQDSEDLWSVSIA